jgi:hypothetical protein
VGLERIMKLPHLSTLNLGLWHVRWNRPPAVRGAGSGLGNTSYSSVIWRSIISKWEVKWRKVYVYFSLVI